jgi:hypothetical protein
MCFGEDVDGARLSIKLMVVMNLGDRSPSMLIMGRYL